MKRRQAFAQILFNLPFSGEDGDGPGTFNSKEIGLGLSQDLTS